MKYGDKRRFVVKKDGRRSVFVLKRSAAATSSGYKLYGYDEDTNSLNLLEDFGISGNPKPYEVRDAAVRRINFYVGGDPEIVEKAV